MLITRGGREYCRRTYIDGKGQLFIDRFGAIDSPPSRFSAERLREVSHELGHNRTPCRLVDRWEPKTLSELPIHRAFRVVVHLMQKTSLLDNRSRGVALLGRLRLADALRAVAARGRGDAPRVAVRPAAVRGAVLVDGHRVGEAAPGGRVAVRRATVVAEIEV